MSYRTLIVDDEKNIRLTLRDILDTMEDMEVEAVSSGEEALKHIENEDYDVVLMDQRLPKMQGLELLRRTIGLRPDAKIIIVTAHGTIESAVEAMKLGAADFIQKPISPEHIREVVSDVLGRNTEEDEEPGDYSAALELARQNIEEGCLDSALEQAVRATSIDSSRPEGHNIVGVIHEMKEEQDDARRAYRMAISVDPSYQSARNNLHRLTGWEPEQKMQFGQDERGDEKRG
ncbi:MAG: response regulator [Planctomycetota bacterium]